MAGNGHDKNSSENQVIFFGPLQNLGEGICIN